MKLVYVVPFCIVLAACGRRGQEIQDCVKGVEQPVSLEKAIQRVKEAGLVVSSQHAGEATAQYKIPVSPGHVELLCETNVNGQRLTTVIHLDLASKTANGLPAKITDDEVTWTTDAQNPGTGRPMLAEHSLNRLNGDYRSYATGAVYAAPPPTYHCSKATTRQF